MRAVLVSLAALAIAGCRAGSRPSSGHVTDAYGAWLAGRIVEPVPPHFVVRELSGSFWFIAPSGRRFLAVSGRNLPASGSVFVPSGSGPAYLTGGIPWRESPRPVPLIFPALPDVWDDGLLPAFTETAYAPAQMGDDPFCLGHLAIVPEPFAALPAGLPVSGTATAAARRWFALRTTGGDPSALRAEYADRYLGVSSAALRAADEHHLVFAGWWEPGTHPDVAAAIGRWGDVVCARLPASPDAVRMAADAFAACRTPLFVWLTGGDDPVSLALLGLPYVIGVDAASPPDLRSAYAAHASRR
jgi:hypothetical protein